jgi:hypothetical protein
MQNACPQIQSVFFFKVSPPVPVVCRGCNETQAQQAIEAFTTFNTRAQKSNFSSLTLNTNGYQVTVTKVGCFYLANITASGTDKQILHVLTGVMVPTVLQVLEIVDSSFALVATKTQPPHAPLKTTKTAPSKSLPKADSVSSAAVTQLMVENLGGIGKLLSGSDVARIERSVIARWHNLYPDHSIEEIEVEETHTGKKVRCRFKALTESKLQGKGLIQLPQKTQTALQTHKGALVTVKPLTE